MLFLSLRFYSQGRPRRRQSIEKVINELEDFKIEIQRRFKKSKFNHTYVFPRNDKISISRSRVRPWVKNTPTYKFESKKHI